MKNKLSAVLFVSAFLIICLIPFACMSFAKGDTSTENRKSASFPSIKTEDGFNSAYLKQLGDYFDDHFAFRSFFVNADSLLQSKIFGTSSVERVVVGTDGWLYYSDTLDDFTGTGLLSERGLYNVSHNLKLLKDYVESFGSEFIFTIAPNKNTLYPDNMPYYYRKADSSVVSNAESLKPLLEKNKIKYVDLFELFRSEKETLYFKRDSHWNGTGAAKVYDALIAASKTDGKTLSEYKIVTDETYIGDLNRMVYPVTAKGETNRYYDTDGAFHVLTKDTNEESAWIMTENEKADSSVLVYRDSFGNSLYPLFAATFGKGFFSKATPYNAQAQMTLYRPEVVICEKVERNLSDFAFYPPVFASVECEPIGETVEKNGECSAEMTRCETNPALLELTGHVDSALLEKDSGIFARVHDGENSLCYETFGLSDENGDNGFKLVLDESRFENSLDIEIIIKTKDGFVSVYSGQYNPSEIGDVDNEQ